MTAAVMNLPFQAGGAVALVTGRTVGRTVMWAGRHYFSQPLRNSGIAVMLLLSGMAGANALYFQTHHHPAPLFGVQEQRVAEASQPMPAQIIPATRPKNLKLPSVTAATPAEETHVIGTAEVVDIQKKLASFELFDAKVDGLFGPRTSRAIRAFEERLGRTPKGELTQDVVDLILTTASIGPAPQAEPLPIPDPLPEVTAKVVAPAAETPVTVAPLPAPAPLTTELQTLPPPPPATMTELAPAPKVTTRDLPDTPEEAVAIAAGVAEEAFESAVQNVQALTAPNPPATVTKRVVQTVPIQPLAPAPAPEVTAVAELPAVTERQVVEQVQRGLASLGFLHATVDGVAGEATAKAIRNFEVYFNYDVTGRVTPGLVKLLVQNGAVI